MAGPFTPEIPADLVEQSKLKALGYRTPLEALAEKFHASPALLRQLNPGATFDRAGEQIMVPNVEVGRACRRPSRRRAAAAARRGAGRHSGRAGSQVTIYVTKATSALTVEDANGKVLFHAPVTSGSEHDPLPIGEWKVTSVQRDARLQLQPRAVLGRRSDALEGADSRRDRTTRSASSGST